MDAKAAALMCMERIYPDLVDLSRRIHAHPELGFKEVRACGWLCETLAGAGFAVERGICDLPTAFVAQAGSGPLHLAICAEYDALPAIGHACGHNLIAAISVGAALAAAPAIDSLGLTLTVIGTPAEEVGDAAGKVLLLERGAFEGQHAALMVHPGPHDLLEPQLLAASAFDVYYQGKAAHASAFPERGINAADALTVAQVAIGLLRQHIRPTDRIHGIITKGGDAANVVPEHTSARYMARARTLDDLVEIRGKVLRCFEAGALATGAALEIRGGDKPYADVIHDRDLAELFRSNAAALGRRFDSNEPLPGSTDMGNVSQVIPSIHPIIGINSLPAVNHQPEFTAHCVSPDAERAIFDGALALAWTALDLAAIPAVRARLLEAAG